MKIPLSITAQYQPNWGVWEGVRELVCNARDAEVEFNAPADVSWYVDKNKVGSLRIKNTGVVMPYEALLLGHSTKMNRSDTIGQFGEGFKIGVLALVRAGLQVKIRNGSEVWTAAIERSDRFKSDVLTFDIQAGRKNEERVLIEVSGFEADVWDSLKERFLWLQRLKDDAYVKSYSGTILLDEKYRGMLFMKGVFIRKMKDLVYGYDLAQGSLNRDRDIVETYTLRWELKKIWEESVSMRPDLLNMYYKMLEDDAEDIRGVDRFNVNDKTLAALVQKFKDSYGDNVIPVKSMGESQEASFAGKRSVVVPERLKSLLDLKIDGIEKVREELAESTTKSYSWSDLSEPQRANLQRAMGLISEVEPRYTLDNVEIVDFRDKSLKGIYKDGKIQIAASELEKLPTATMALIHEFSHEYGGDGTREHTLAVQNIWMQVFGNLVAVLDTVTQKEGGDIYVGRKLTLG